MAESRRKGVLLTLALIALAGVLYWGWLGLEWEEVEQDQGFRLEAQRNPYLAAEYFLRQQGLAVKSVDDLRLLEKMPEAPATLILTRAQQVLSERHWQALWKWLESGGRLITTAQYFTDPETGRSQDELNKRLGVQLFPAPDAKGFDDNGPASRHWLQHAVKFDPQDCACEQDFVQLPLEGEAPLNIALRPGQLLQDSSGAAIASAGNEDGSQFMQYRVGQGMVTVLTDLSLWSNGRIGCHDHAYLLWRLTHDGGVWILYNTDMPSLASLLWNAAALPLVLAVLLLLMWLWRRARRFGPLLAPVQGQRRRLMEHMHASSLYHWRHGHYEELVRQLRQSITQAMRYRCQGFDGLGDEQAAALIAQLVHHQEDDVRWALTCPRCANRETFVRQIQILQSIRNSL